MKKTLGGLAALLFLLAVHLAAPGQAPDHPPASAALAKTAQAGVLTGKTERLSAAELAAAVYAVAQEGDVIFQITNSRQAKAIQTATGSRYTHCGILLEKDGRLQVFEAVRTVSWTPLEDWLDRGLLRHYVLMRLKDPAPLTPRVLAAMRKDSTGFYGKDYDLLFQWDDTQIYCSELVWKLYRRNADLELGKLRTFRDYNLDHEEVRRIANERYGLDIPLDALVIAPSDIMDSGLLEVVSQN